MRKPTIATAWALVTAVILTAFVFTVPQASAQSGSTKKAVTMGPVDPDAVKEWTTTASGLKYRILRKSNGQKATAANAVTVHYKGWLPQGEDGAQGKTFDSSYTRGKPASFPLGQVIKGWTEGMQLVGKGGMIELQVPPNLGYGANGAGSDIPPNATLRFIVELIDIK